MAEGPEKPIINQCPQCQKPLDVSELPPFSKITCPNCQGMVRVRTRLGQYEIQHLVGEGGMSQVFAAHDLTLGRTVALKILHQSLSEDAKLTAMFEREATLTASINHPNVVKVYTGGHEHGYFYIAMELVEATSIEQLIAEQGARDEASVLKMAKDVVSGLKAAYQGNLIHRDIKPGNILETHDGTAKLVDFGLAVAQDGLDENEDIWATPFYVPPEKLVREPDTYLGDIYALGATCYHALAGSPPFLANTNSLEELIAIKSAGVNLAAAAPHASPPSIKLFEEMMAHSPTDRPQSYDALLKRIADCQGDSTSSHGGHTMAIPPRPQAPTKSNTWLKIGLPIVGVLAILIGILAFVFLNKGENGDIEDSVRIISAQEREASQKMLAGRNAMARLHLPEAKRIFSELEKSPNFGQPSKGWNTFSLGLVDLLGGNELKARDHFNRLKNQKGFKPEIKSHQKFFTQTGNILSRPLPVMRSDFSAKENSFESVGLLAAGLKNWQQGQFEEAVQFLEDFEKMPSSSEPWINQMKTVVAPYKADYALFKKLPNPSKHQQKAKLQSIRTELNAAADNLQTRGSMRRVLLMRVKRIDTFLERQPTLDSSTSNPNPTKPSGEGEWSDAEKSELTQIQSLVQTFSEYKENYLFGEATQKLEAYTAESPRGKALKNDLVTGYQHADRFLTNLIERLNETTYNGEILRKQGNPINAKITSATTEEFTVDLGFGPNLVPIDQFKPEWLVTAATTTLSEPSSETVIGWKQAFWFAAVTGQSTKALEIARKVVPVDSEFKDAGSRFKFIKF